MIGTTAGSYRITAVISAGGMGTVYRAEHTLIGRTAAVKVLHPEMCSNPDIVQRFFNEAKATTSIKHPGIVEIFDYGHLPSGHAYLVMEFLEGRTLAARNKQRGHTPETEAAAILRGVCGALAAAHAKGIVHRDLKPDNIYLVPDADSPLAERAKILDFGIAKLTDVGLAGSATRTGAVMGTPTYMSPEQCKGAGEVDQRADLYSLGCIFYEMVAGRPPFNSAGAGELIGAHLFMPPEPPSRHGAAISPDVEALIMALLAKDPSQRPQSAVELGQLLGQIASRGGWGSSTNWERPSMSSMPSMGAPSTNPGVHSTPAHYTPSHTPQSFTPAHTPVGGTPYPQAHTPFPPQTGPHTPMPTGPDKPTTLSGAASHSVVQAPPARGSKRVLAIAGALVLVGGIGIVVAMSGGSGDHASTVQSGAQPAQPTADTKPATPTTETKSAETKPAETKPIETAPAESAPTETKSVETKPAESTPVETKPADTAVAAKPPTSTKPADATGTKPKTTTTTGSKKPKPKNDPLLETDL